jgi:hypothetical protein
VDATLLLIFLLLLAAHCIADFLLQTAWMVREKKHLSVLSLHSAIHAALTYLCLQQWDAWIVPLLVFVAHFCIDYTKVRLPRTALFFALDQLAHALSLLAIAFIASWYVAPLAGELWIVQPMWIVVAGGLSITVWGVGFFVMSLSQATARGNDTREVVCVDTLPCSAVWIGKIERALVFLLIVTGNAAGVLLVAVAKVVLIVKAGKVRSVVRVTLMRSLWSIGLAVVFSLLTAWALGCRL